MKTYPSIIRCAPGATPKVSDVYIFDKLDGSNLRFEWTKKRGWFKFGTRRRLFDETDEVFGKAISIFASKLGPQLEAVIARNKWQHAVAFAEFHGPRSFAGVHHQDDVHVLSLLDVAPNKKGIMPPKEYLKLVYPYVTERASFIERSNWNEQLVRDVENGLWTLEDDPDAPYEGVVGKYMDGKRLKMLKAKTQAWKNKVKALYGDNANKILES